MPPAVHRQRGRAQAAALRPPRTQGTGTSGPARVRKTSHHPQGCRASLPGARARRRPRSRAHRKPRHHGRGRTLPPSPAQKQERPHAPPRMLFYDWKGPLSGGARGGRTVPLAAAPSRDAAVWREGEMRRDWSRDGAGGGRRKEGIGARGPFFRFALCDQCFRPGRFSPVSTPLPGSGEWGPRGAAGVAQRTSDLVFFSLRLRKSRVLHSKNMICRALPSFRL